MTVHALVLQRALSILSYSECKITKIFRGFAPGPHSEGLTAPSVSPAAPQKSFCYLISASIFTSFLTESSNLINNNVLNLFTYVQKVIIRD